MRRVLAVLTLFMLWGGIIAAPAFAGGSGSSSRNGLTCDSNWDSTWGSTSCRGTSTQKWRLHVACAWQSDYAGAWHYGPGSDGFECNFSIHSASVQWE